jgi:hypothetical protein
MDPNKNWYLPVKPIGVRAVYFQVEAVFDDTISYRYLSEERG